MSWPPPDPALLERARKGDVEATRAVLSSLALVLPFSMTLLAPTGLDVEDLCQEVLLQVYRSLPSLKEPERFRSWVWGIARNCVRDRNKQRRRRPVETPMEGVSEPQDTSETPDDALDRHRLARRALDALDPELREVYALALQGFSRTEMASILSLPPGTVASRLGRARDEVRAALDALRPAPQPGHDDLKGTF